MLALVLLVGALTGSGAARAERCSCVGVGVACESIWWTDAAFVGRVLSIVKPDPNSNMRTIRVDVTEAFKGVSPGEINVFTGSGGGDCGVEFIVGGTYLVFGHLGQDGKLGTSICSRTRLVAEAAEDLEFFRGVYQTPRELGSVRGTAMRYSTDQEARRKDPLSGPRVDGLRITLQGYARTWEATTGASGSYEFRVPPGEYRMFTHARDGLYAYPEDGVAVKVSDGRACVNQNVYLQADGRIAGRVVDHSDQPIPWLGLELIGEGLYDERLQVNHWATTNDQGEFEFRPVRPGRHRIAVAYQDRPDAPYPVVWLTAESGIELAAEQRRDMGAIRLPSGTTTVVITGEVVDAGGKPLAGATVRHWDGHHSGIGGKSDARGQVQFSVLAGRKYTLSWSWSSGVGPSALHLHGESEPFEAQPGLKPVRIPAK